MAKIVTITNPLTGQPAQVDQLDHTAQQIDDGLNIARGVSNPNLLDNWYFVNPVDQRGGRVVVPNTTYYSDNTLATAAGTTSAYVTAYRYATGTANGVNYASFKLEDSDTAPTYYAAPENVVRGYTGSGYGTDRWKLLTSQCTVTIDNDGITLQRNGGDPWIYAQPLEPEFVTALTGKSVVISTLTDAGLVEFPVSSAFTAEQSVVSTSGTCIWLSTAGYLFLGTTADSVKLKAAKLELGTTQTLAHQDENGNWVLNEIPDYGEQLARCQRYFQTFATESLRPTNALDFRPVMRATPALSTITVGGKTLYTASADL